MRLCDEKDSLHGRVFFCERNCGWNRESDKFGIFLTYNHTFPFDGHSFPGHEKSSPAMK